MYLMSKGAYTCDICGFEEPWDAHDDVHGDMWECEVCGTNFCTDCFVKALGRPAFDRMTHECDKVMCAEHYKKLQMPRN